MRSIVPAVLIAIGVCLLAVAQSMAQERAQVEEVGQSAPAIRVTTAATRELVEELTVNGTVLPKEEALVSTDLNGLTILSIEADQADQVAKGQVLARLDRVPLELQAAQIAANRAQAEAGIAQARSQIADAEVAVRQANETLQRTRKLSDKGVVSKAQLDNAVNAYDSAKARLNSAKMMLTSAEAQLGVIDAQARDVAVKLGKTEIKAPAAGLVLARNTTLGSVVSASAGPLFRIAIDGQLELAAELAETALPRVAVGMTVAVSVAGSRELLDGRIRLIEPEVDQRTRLGTIRMSLPENPNVRVGNFATGEIEVERRTGVAVPASAIIYKGADAFVQLVRQGVVSTVPVTLGVRSGGYVEIVDGLSEGDEVIHRAGTFVADGDRITPIRDEVIGAVSQ